MASSSTRNIFSILPTEVRDIVWQALFPDLQVFAGVDHVDCPYMRPHEEHFAATLPCPCNYHQLQPLLVSRRVHAELKRVMDKAPVVADYTAGRYMRLTPRLEHRIVELALDETVYPVISCRLGILGDVSFQDFLEVFPLLKKVIMPEGLGSGMGLRFPSHIPIHIASCLRSLGGPEEMPNADMLELVRSDLSGSDVYSDFLDFTESIVSAAGMEIVSTYRYNVTVSECWWWPFETSWEVYNKSFVGVSCCFSPPLSFPRQN
jgi:hypothetical protein